MKENLFVNEFITLGAIDFFEKKKNNLFERHVFECLCNIYGEENIKNIIDSKNEVVFSDLIKMYGFSESMYTLFLSNINKYSQIKYVLDEKTYVLTSIEASLINMFIYKCLSTNVSLEEVSHFENDLLNDLDIIKMHYKYSINPNEIRLLWEQKKKILFNNIELEEIIPEYLDDYTYSQYGTSLDQVKDMDYRMVEELNAYIKNKGLVVIPEVEVTKNTVWKTMNTAISSGSGFVDALMILSIVCTEISLGVIYFFLHM